MGIFQFGLLDVAEVGEFTYKGFRAAARKRREQRRAIHWMEGRPGKASRRNRKDFIAEYGIDALRELHSAWKEDRSIQIKRKLEGL